MSYTISIFYRDEYDQLQEHTLHDVDAHLMYDDYLAEPIKVRNLMQRGFVIGRMDGEALTRCGSYIPPSRIVRVFWEDDYTP